MLAVDYDVALEFGSILSLLEHQRAHEVRWHGVRVIGSTDILSDALYVVPKGGPLLLDTPCVGSLKLGYDVLDILFQHRSDRCDS